MIEIALKDVGATPKLMKREVNRINREAAEQMGLYWHANFRAKHFTVAGAAEYGYAARQGERGNIGQRGFKRSYTGRKLIKHGHTRPLVWSGDSERFSRIPQIKATSRAGETVGRVIISARNLNFRPGKGRIDMRGEMTRVSPQEAVVLANVAGTYLTNKYKAITASMATTIN